jgi:predicted RNA methylase
MTTLILDDASNGMASDLARLKLAREGKTLLQERESLTASAADTIRKLKIGKRIREIVEALGLRPAAKKPDAAPVAVRTEPTGEFYPDEGKRTTGQRQKANDAAIALMREIQASGRAVTDEDRAILAKYSGNGGGLVGADGKTGSPHEYYTPKEVAGAMWNLLAELGFNGGSVLDPSSGTGIFTSMRPKSAVMSQVELDQTSGTINGLVNNGPTVTTAVSPFEAFANDTPDEIYDAVITNVPFGDRTKRGGNEKLDSRFQDESLEGYFVQRALQKVKPNGLAAFIVPKAVVSGLGSRDVKLRTNCSLMAEFVGAYRLPNSIFTTAAADVTTDLIVFRKFSRETRRKVEELEAQSPATLKDANILWEPFVSGAFFKTVGRKYILGEEGTTKGKYGEVAAVINTDSISNIVKLIKRFPDSHINWELLDMVPTAPITYTDGDTINKDGATLEMRDGEWVVLDSAQAASKTVLDLADKLSRPLAAVNSRVTFAQAGEYVDAMQNAGRFWDVGAWLTGTVKTVATLAESERETWWQAITAGMAVQELLSEADSVEPQNYVTAYPELAAQLAKVERYATRTVGKAAKLVKDGLLSIQNARRKGEFTALWKGEILANVQDRILSPTQIYEKARYENEDETGFVSVSKLREAMSDFDPLEDDDWCMGADGETVMHANDYYTGSYGRFLKQAEADLAAATDPRVRAKIARQMDRAKERISVVDVADMTFNLFTPHVTMAQKLEFLKTYVSVDIFINDKGEFDIKQSNPGKYASAEEMAAYKAMQRFVKSYLKNQTITTMTKQADAEANPAAEAALMRRIKDITDRAKAQFDSWARANDEIQASLHQKLNDPENLKFIEVPDGTPLDIPNLNVEDFEPHAYQYAACRRYARHFGGVLGFDVGLGKTLTALAATQYAQSIGVKKKTIFVVPNATLTNWQKEAGKAYLNTDDCLFVGVITDKKGKKKVDNNQVKIDLNTIRENRHAKIFMTIEAFKQIPLREETLDAYVEYLAHHDDAYSVENDKSKTESIKQDSLLAEAKDLGSKSGALPYFEDLGVDSLVLDEAHNYKNSKVTSAEFTGAKYLSDPQKSQRGMDMQAKAWFVRGLSDRGDGVVSLTATPVTNSPLEVYSMLTLALGEEEVNNMYGVTGADTFMAAACDIEEREEENIVGKFTATRTFTGLQNAGLLRRLLQTSCLIKTAEDVKADGVDIRVPQAEEISTAVDIGPDNFATLIAYKNEYMEAVKLVKAGGGGPDDKLTASPFNLIRKMTKVINDPEMDKGVFVFKFSDDEKEGALKALLAFNKKKVKEIRDTLDPMLGKEFVTEKSVRDTVTGDFVVQYNTTIQAFAATDANGDNEIRLPSTEYETQEALIKLLEAEGVKPRVKISPKLAAVIANVKKEAAYPRHMGHAKQIIFCDELGLHPKIRLALAQEVGVPLSKIKIVNAVAVDVAGMQDVQDGFNADGEENRYEYVIANKKAEVGINLQKGCQAIHHMTIGWTPDSTHQRNGRGVRQGNTVEKVMVYHYDANGTFDAYKRKIVDIKADWIGALMSGDSQKIKIEGDMSAADYELLANAVGDAEAMETANRAIADRAKREKIQAARVQQIQYVRTIEGANVWLNKFGVTGEDETSGFNAWVNSKIASIRAQVSIIADIKTRQDETESDLMRARLAKKYAEERPKLDAALLVIGGLATPGKIPAERTYRSTLTDEDRASAAYANWKKELTLRTNMRDDSRRAFLQRSEDGYTVDSLDAHARGEAAVVMGTLVRIGSFVENGDALLVVRSGKNRQAGNLYGYNPADQSEIELLKIAKPVFTDKGSARWRSLVEQAVRMDEATIADQRAGSVGPALEVVVLVQAPVLPYRAR